ncbi:MAG: hypothetical protein NTY69_05975 [Methylococcales bacterium]|nr:hypothetical protein [Methylococcales bacterium]
MKKNNIILASGLVVCVLAVFNVTVAGNSQPNPNENPHNSMHRWIDKEQEIGTKAIGLKEEQSVAWFVAHTKEAREQNKLCYDSPELKESVNCVNSLNALKLAFASASGR